MKVKYGIITVFCLLACALFGWLAMRNFQFGFVLASVLFLLTAAFWFIRLLKRNDESKPQGKAVLTTIFLVLSCIAALLSQFVNAVVAYRPMFVYDEYYRERFCTFLFWRYNHNALSDRRRRRLNCTCKCWQIHSW